jgi:ATP/maltotriose-dependent transcriptional regulator MalT
MVASRNHALAYYHALHGDWEKAEQLMDAVDTALQGTDNRIIPILYFGLYGLVTLERGDLEKAERIIANNLALAREAGSAHYEAEALSVQAQLLKASVSRRQLSASNRIFERLEAAWSWVRPVQLR